jgi:hypothetical protein
MKHSTIASAILLAGISISGESFAACPGTAQDASIELSGKTVCGVPGADYPNGGAGSPDRWHEVHNGVGSGMIDDLHSNTAADPRENGIGTWVASGSTVTYTYGSLPPIQYTLKKQGASYNFCHPAGGADTWVTATIIAGGNCP